MRRIADLIASRLRTRLVGLGRAVASLAPWLALGWALALLAPTTVFAQGVLGPLDAGTLRVTGKLAAGEQALAATKLAEWGLETMTTAPPWSAGSSVVEGVSLPRLLERLGAAGERVEAIGADGRSLGFAIADGIAHQAFIATRLAGEPITSGLRGPFWLVFPAPGDAGRRMGPPPMAALVALRID